MSASVTFIFSVAFAVATFAQAPQTGIQPQAAKTWSSVMYLGGAADIRGKSLDWDSKLTVSSDRITFQGKGKNSIHFEIPTASIRVLDYSGHKHANDGATTAGFLTGGLAGALLGAQAKSVDHYAILEYELADGTPSAVLFRLHKNNHQEIVDALRQALPKK